MMQTFRPLYLTHSCSLTSSTWSRPNSLAYSLPDSFSFFAFAAEAVASAGAPPPTGEAALACVAPSAVPALPSAFFTLSAFSFFFFFTIGPLPLACR